MQESHNRNLQEAAPTPSAAGLGGPPSPADESSSQGDDKKKPSLEQTVSNEGNKESNNKEDDNRNETITNCTNIAQDAGNVQKKDNNSSEISETELADVNL